MSEFTPITSFEIDEFVFELEWGNPCVAESVDHETDTARILGGFILTDYFAAMSEWQRQLGFDPTVPGEYEPGVLYVGNDDPVSDRSRFADAYRMMIHCLDEGMQNARIPHEDESERVVDLVFTDSMLGVVNLSMNQSDLRHIDGTLVARTRRVHVSVLDQEGTARTYVMSQQYENAPMHMSAIQADDTGETRVAHAALTKDAQNYLHKIVVAVCRYLHSS